MITIADPIIIAMVTMVTMAIITISPECAHIRPQLV
jgi:hypothetical protein